MKNIITLVFVFAAATASAQWSNTTNQFYDELHIPVSNVAGAQKNPIVLNSYPDGGYFVIWEDERNLATTNQDIYAQKYDAAGNRLWASGGVPVVNGPNAQRYVVSTTTQDYRNRSYAATDSAGGFYIGYVDDSVNNYSWERIAVQHMRSNGTGAFGGPGYIIAATPAGQGYTYSAPLLTADGNSGCYLSFSRNFYGENYIYVFSYKDENGTLKNYGGGRVNENGIQRSDISPCGIWYYIDYPGTSVQDYNIWYDGQGGCNVIMAMNGNAAGQGKMLAYNRIWRAKKDSRVKTFVRNTSGVACPRYVDYKKDDVYRLYTFFKHDIITTCGTVDGQTVYVVTSNIMTSNGYQLIDEGGYDYNFPKGTTVFPNGNINVDLIAVTKRTYTNNTVSPFVVQCYAYRTEKYDSVPFQRASFSNPELGFNPSLPASSDKLNNFRDTILASSNYYPDFSFTSGGTSVGGQHIYASALMSTTGDRAVRLQHLTVEKQSADSFAVKYETTTKYGEVIGKEINTGFSSYNIYYDFPLVKVDEYGRALFYIREYYRSARVSPIRNGAELAWGAMGRPIGTGLYNGNYYLPEQPVVALEPNDGSGIIAWRDDRIVPGNTGQNIFMLHLDSLSEFNYAPPYKPVKVVPNPYGGTFANPVYLAGSSKVWSLLEVASTINYVQTTGPLAEIKDEYNLGAIAVSNFQNRYALRSYNNVPYLDRNYTIKTENTPAGPNLNIGLRLFFTSEEFNTLKLADNAIQSPADLIAIRQPNATTNVPDAYIPVTGEQVISPTAWKAVPGGYYLELNGNGFGNFFIQKPPAFGTCPGGNAALTSAITGGSYQWQVNSGSGFTNIANSTNYSGANTINLQLNSIPNNWYGYQYRCVVDGTAGSIFFLKFTATWTGATSTDWNNPANWGCGAVPDANTDVVINSGSVIVNNNSACRTLTVKPGASVTVRPGVNLDVMR